MPLVVEGTPNERAIIERWLQEICPSAQVVAGPIGSPAIVTVSGSPSFIPPEREVLPACCCLNALALSTFTTTIRPVQPGFMPPDSGGRTIRGLGGGSTTPHGPGSYLQPRLGEEGRSPAGVGSGSDVYIDITDNGGKGYFVVDDQGNPINDPPFLILAHELCTGHAYHSIRGTTNLTPGTRERQAVDSENEIRRSLKDASGNPRFSERSGTEGGPIGARGIPVKKRPPDRR